MDARDEIKDRLPIEDLVGRTVDLKRSGASLKGLCPFHGEKTPSFYVSPARGSFHCFGCGRGGDIFTFQMESQQLSFREALEELARETGVTLPDRAAEMPSLKTGLYEINRLAAEFYRAALDSREGERGRHYLDERRFDDIARERFTLGFAPDGRSVLVDHLRNAGQEDSRILAAGLALQDDNTRELRDRFRGRLMLPIRDAAGHIIGFGGRILGDGQPKYLNSPQTEIFDKSSVLYGIHLAAEAVRKEHRVVLVEGYFDAVRAQVAGFGATVASLGTAVTVPQLTALSRLAPVVVLALDPDPAGQAAAARAAINALAEVTDRRGRAEGSAGAVDLRVARLPAGGADPDELIRDDPTAWQQAIDSSVAAFEFFFTTTLAGIDRTGENWKQEAIDKLLPPIQRFSSSTGWQATWIEQLARETGVDPRALQRSMPAGRPARTRGAGPTRVEQGREIVNGTTGRVLASDPVVVMEEALLSLLLQLVALPEEVLTQLDDLRWVRPQHAAILQVLRDWAPSGNYEYELLRERLPESARPLADDLHGRTVPLPEPERVEIAVETYLARLRSVTLQAELVRARQVMEDIGPDDRPAANSSLTQLLVKKLEVDRLVDDLSRRVMQATGGGPGAL